MFNEPAIQHSAVDAAIDAHIIEHEHSAFATALLEQHLDELYDVSILDSARLRGMDQSVFAKVGCADNRAHAMVGGPNCVGRVTSCLTALN